MKFIFSTLALIICFTINSVSQDIHLSQFNASPANLSPALTGLFNGDYRFVANQRSQWRSITSPNTFSTFGGSIDTKGVLNNKNIGCGVSIYNDIGGDADFTTLQINFSVSYSKKITQDSSHVLVLGVQSGLTQRNLNFNKLRFDNQYSGKYYDPNIFNQESFNTNKLNYANLNGGICWVFNYSEKLNFLSGLGIFNINKPKQSFFNTAEIALDRRFNLFTNAHVKLSEKLVLMPGILSVFQGKYREKVFGCDLKHILNSNKNNFRALNIGMWRRTKDAGFLSLGIDYDNITAAISYDITTSKLNNASNYKGGFEFSVIYIITKFKPPYTKYRVCPSFI